MPSDIPVSPDYSSRDYASLRASMLAYAKTVVPEWLGAAIGDPNDFGVALIEIFAYQGDILSFYADRIANETVLSTATQRSSVLEHAALFDYIPSNAAAATVPLSFTVTSSVPVTIPAGFAVQTGVDDLFDPVTFTTDTNLDFPAGTSQVKAVPATEGTVVIDEIVATQCGDADAEYPLQQSPIVVGSIQVRVVETPNGTGVVWQPVTRMLDAGPTDNAYAISIDQNDSVTLLFGDGVNGRIPPRGSVVHASYRVGGGQDGNVLANSLTLVVNPRDIVYPSLGAGQLPATPATIVVTNLSNATGGADSESLDSIRTNAPRALRTSDRAVTLADFRGLALAVPTAQVAKARAVSSVYTNVTLYVAPPGGGLPSQDILSQVVAYLEDRKLANVTVVASGPVYVGIDIELEIDVDPRFDKNSVIQDVRNVLAALLSFDVVDFGFRVALSDVYSEVSSVLGVRTVVISRLDRAGGNGTSDVAIRDNEIPAPGAFAVYATGGVTTSPGTLGDIIGNGTATPPTAPGAPTINVIRCDPNSTHVELSWVGGANTTAYDVTVAYQNTSGAVVQASTIGTFTSTSAVLDLPFIGKGRAQNIRFFVNAYNGAVGPVTSAGTSVPYTCES